MSSASEEGAIAGPVLLQAAFDCAPFDCGSSALNDYLRRFAWANQQNRSARTYVALRGRRIIGYYTLAAGSVGREDAPERIAKGLARHPVPVILLARLAVDSSEKGLGLGTGLLKDALRRCVSAAEQIGCRAVLVHAKDESAARFYAKFGFVPSLASELHLLLLIKDIEATLRDRRHA